MKIFSIENSVQMDPIAFASWGNRATQSSFPLAQSEILITLYPKSPALEPHERGFDRSK